MNSAIYAYAIIGGCNMLIILFSAILSMSFLWIVGRSIITGVVTRVGRGAIYRSKTPLLFYVNITIFSIGSICAALWTLSGNFYK